MSGGAERDGVHRGAPAGVGTAAGPSLAAHLATDVPVSTPEVPAELVRAALAGRRFATTAAVAVCQGRPAGRADPLRRPARGARWHRHGGAGRRRRSGGGRWPDREVAVQRAVHRGRDTVAVVDDGGRFLGLIPPSQILAVLAAEHDEDLARLSGFTHDVSAARIASVELVVRRYRHRLPWLLLGLVGAVLSADLMSSL
jgi:magnesium transporter